MPTYILTLVPPAAGPYLPSGGRGQSGAAGRLRGTLTPTLTLTLTPTPTPNPNQVVSADSGGHFRAWCPHMFVCVQSFSSKAAVQGLGLNALLAPDEAAPRLLAIAAGAAALEQFTAYATEPPKAQVRPP